MSENQGHNDSQTNGDQFEEDHAKQFREMLLNGLIIKAVDYMREHKLHEQVISLNVREAYDLYKDTEQYQLALQIAEEFYFAEQDILVMKIAEWNRINNEKKFEEAAEWAKKQGLSKVEILRSAKMAYEQYIRDNKTDDALRIIDSYNLPKEELFGFTINEFNRAFKERKYYKSAMLGITFNFSDTRTLSAAVNACLSAVEDDNFTLAINIIERFELISDKVFDSVSKRDMEKLLKKIHDNLVEPSFVIGKIKLMQEFAQKIGLTNYSFQHSLLKNFEMHFLQAAIQTHNRLLQNNDEKSARFVRDSFDLLSAPISYELYSSLIKSAEKYHESILQFGKLSDAIAFKNNYGLFTIHTVEDSKKTAARHVAQFIVKSLEKLDMLSIKIAIVEYKVPKEQLRDAVFTAVMNLADKGAFDKAFAVLDEFEIKISNEDDRYRVVHVFQNLMKEKQYLPAVEFARRFHLHRSLIEEGVYRAWQNEFNAKNYDVAFDIKNRFKLNKKLALPLARRAYFGHMDKKDYIFARSIRKDYGLPIGFTGWIQEIIRIIFSK